MQPNQGSNSFINRCHFNQGHGTSGCEELETSNRTKLRESSFQGCLGAWFLAQICKM